MDPGGKRSGRSRAASTGCFLPRLFAGHGVLKMSRRVGSGQEVFKVARVGSDRVKRFLNLAGGSGWVKRFLSHGSGRVKSLSNSPSLRVLT